VEADPNPTNPATPKASETAGPKATHAPEPKAADAAEAGAAEAAEAGAAEAAEATAPEPTGASAAGDGAAEGKAREVCLRMLAGAPRTRAQLAEALRRRDVPDEVAERVLGRFSEVGLIDDEAFARAWVQSRHNGRGLAQRALAAELRLRGVADETVDGAVEALDPAQEERTARALVARRLPATAGLDPVKRMRRLMGMLARKGYSPGFSYRIVRESLADEGAALDGLPDDPPLD
jgi:regulatory protein